MKIRTQVFEFVPPASGVCWRSALGWVWNRWALPLPMHLPAQQGMDVRRALVLFLLLAHAR
jgi:hypothetical protein